MNVTETQGMRPSFDGESATGIGLMSLALAFYFGFIALLIYRGHH